MADRGNTPKMACTPLLSAEKGRNAKSKDLAPFEAVTLDA
jgi:hypothetical protein